MTNKGTHWRWGLSLLLTLVMLICGVGMNASAEPAVQLGTLKIRVVDSTPRHSPIAGVRLYVTDSNDADYYHVREGVSDSGGYLEFDLSGLDGTYSVLFDSTQNYDFWRFDLVVADGLLMSMEETVPQTADFCYDLMAVPENISVTLDANGGTFDGESSVTYDSRDGNQLLSGTEPDGRTAYAKIAEYELTPLSDDGDCDVLGPGGYELDGWYTERSGGTRVVEGQTKFYAEHSTIYARWVNTVHFDSNGGSGSMADQPFIYGESRALRKNTFTHADGLHFAGWNTRADGTGISYGDEEPLTSPTANTLYAQWNAFGPAAFIIPADVTTIEASAFEGIAAESVEIGENVQSIGARAFADCSGLREIFIPASVLHIDDSAFAGCEDVTVYGVEETEGERIADLHGFPFINLNAQTNALS